MPRGEIQSQQICWSCQNAVPSEDGKRGCEWSRDLRPVPGWEAEIKVKGTMGVMWHITSCPKYIADPPRAKVSY